MGKAPQILQPLNILGKNLNRRFNALCAGCLYRGSLRSFKGGMDNANRKVFDFIHREVLDNHEVYFDATKKFEDIISKYFITKEKSREIINLLKEDNMGVTKTHLSHELSMHMETLTKYLILLEKYNVISKIKIDNRYLYFLKREDIMVK